MQITVFKLVVVVLQMARALQMETVLVQMKEHRVTTMVVVWGTGMLCTIAVMRPVIVVANGPTYLEQLQEHKQDGPILRRTGTFGSDSHQPHVRHTKQLQLFTANWASANGVEYDYAIFFR